MVSIKDLDIKIKILPLVSPYPEYFKYLQISKKKTISLKSGQDTWTTISRHKYFKQPLKHEKVLNLISQEKAN